VDRWRIGEMVLFRGKEKNVYDKKYYKGVVMSKSIDSVDLWDGNRTFKINVKDLRTFVKEAEPKITPRAAELEVADIKIGVPSRVKWKSSSVNLPTMKSFESGVAINGNNSPRSDKKAKIAKSESSDSQDIDLKK